MNRLSARNLAKFVCASGLCVLLVACGKESPEALVKSAQDYLAKGDAGAAVIQLRNALQKTPDNAEARFLLGSALVDRRDPAGAVKELRKSLELGYPVEKVVPVLARALTDIGDVRIGDRIRKDGAPRPRSTSTTEGDNWQCLGVARKHRRPRKTAFAAALAAKPDYADALLGIATLRAASGNLEETTKIVDKILAQPNPPAEATLFKARLLLAAGKLDEGTALLQKLAAAKPDNLQARYLLTSLALDKGDLEQATAQVAAIRKVSKQDLRAYYFEALIASRKDDLPAARAAVLQVLKGSPEHVPSLLLAGEIEYRAKQYNQAEDYLRRALKGVPGSLYAQRLLAANYLRMGSPGRALEVLQPALSRGSQDPNLMTVAGEAYLAVGDYPKAALYFAQVSTLDPKNAAVRTRRSGKDGRR